MANPFSGIITPALKTLYTNMIDSLLETSALTVPCRLIFGDTKWTLCPNCIYDAVGKKSSGRYKTGGPISFTHGMCPYCNGVGRIPAESTDDTVYLMPIWDSKNWMARNDGGISSPVNPEEYVQTLSQLATTYSKIKKAKKIVIDTNIENYNRNHFERYGEPGIVGWGASSYVLTMWKKIG